MLHGHITLLIHTEETKKKKKHAKIYIKLFTLEESCFYFIVLFLAHLNVTRRSFINLLYSPASRVSLLFCCCLLLQFHIR